MLAVCASRSRVHGVTAAGPGPFGSDSPALHFREMTREVEELPAFRGPAQPPWPPRPAARLTTPPRGACTAGGSRLRSLLQARGEGFQSDFVLYSAFLSQSKGT